MSLVLLLCVQHLPRLPHFPQFVSYLRLRLFVSAPFFNHARSNCWNSPNTYPIRQQKQFRLRLCLPLWTEPFPTSTLQCFPMTPVVVLCLTSEIQAHLPIYLPMPLCLFHPILCGLAQSSVQRSTQPVRVHTGCRTSLVLLLCVQHLPRLPHFPQFVSYLRLLSHLFTHASLLVPPDLVWSLRRGVSHSNGFFVRGCFATFAIFSPQFVHSLRLFSPPVPLEGEI